MKRKLILLLVAVVLAGCGGPSQSIPQLGADYRTGTSAIELNFLPNSPPQKIFDTDELYIGLELRNKGAHDVTDGTIYFSGFAKSAFSGGSQQGFTRAGFPFTLEGKSFYNPEGGYAAYSFSENIRPLQVTSYSPTFLVTACYTYSTIASAEVCIDPNLYSNTNAQKACVPKDISLSGGQGGPVEVTQVDVNPSRNSVRLTFHIRNSGGGLVYDKTALSDCNPASPRGISPQAMNKVHIDSVRIGGAGNEIVGDCKPSQDLRLVDGSGLLMCEYRGLEGRSAYLAPLTIKISYGYRSSISRTVKIIQTPR